MRFLLWRTSSSWHKKERPSKADNVIQSEDSGEWYVEINTLEELISFAEKEDTLIIDAGGTYTSGHGENKKEFYVEPSIEIYDDYRE